jgi:hypothetical protein
MPDGANRQDGCGRPIAEIASHLKIGQNFCVVPNLDRCICVREIDKREIGMVCLDPPS